MSSMKCVGIMAAAGAAATGGFALYNGIKGRKRVVAEAQAIADKNNGKIPTGGMTKDGALWDGFTTMDEVKKKTKAAVLVSSAINAVVGAASTALVAGLTLLAKAKIK